MSCHIISLLLLGLNLHFWIFGCWYLLATIGPQSYPSWVFHLLILWFLYLKYYIFNSLLKLRYFSKICLLIYLNETTLPSTYIYVILRPHKLISYHYNKTGRVGNLKRLPKVVIELKFCSQRSLHLVVVFIFKICKVTERFLWRWQMPHFIMAIHNNLGLL